jgi:16S rRNA (guanine966-N2)-methyltransferase
LRIIAGSRRGKKLAPIKGERIRPTADRVRESIFNIITGWLDRALVLDLFAGTGALGIEALSRGARMAIFIDRDPSALVTLKKNIHACRFDQQSHVIRWDVSKDLQCFRPAEYRFDIVFMDPPYCEGLINSTLSNLSNQGLVSTDALIVVEHAVSEPLIGSPNEFTLSEQRRYGKTLVSFLRSVL